ncbi:MAG: hypothetical protein KDC98_06430 [Planctomycetes bacterium]|nr:hypothetical protein [Planctomycetota bacterium]
MNAKSSDALAGHRNRLEQLGRFFMGTSDVHQALRRLCGKLDELGIPYAICGGLAVNAHGHLRATTDVDVLLDPEGLRRFKENSLGLGWLERFAGSRGVEDTDRGIPIDVLLAGGIPGDGTPRGVVFPEPGDASVEIDGYRYLELGKLVELKLAAGLSAPDRPRDFDDVIQLIRANSLTEDFADRLHPYVQAKYHELLGYAQNETRLPE